MINTLTEAQQAQMPFFTAKWIQKLTDQRFDEINIKKYVEFCYQLVKLSTPLIFLVDSPLACQYAAHIFKNFKIDLIQVWAQVGDQVGDQVWDQVWDQVRDQKLTFEEFQYRSYIWDANWIAFFDFFDRVCQISTPLFQQYRDLLEQQPIWYWLSFEKLAIVSRPPTQIHFDAYHRLHSTKGMAIQWKDGSGYYFVHGIKFTAAEFSRFFPIQNIDMVTVLKLDNAEQRAAIIQEYGLDVLLDHLESKTVLETAIEQVDTPHFHGEKTGYLIEFQLDRQTYRCVVLPDHATNRKYAILVPRECDTYLHAKMWHNGFDKAEWNRVQYQTQA